MAVGRALGTVVVTVHGNLGPEGSPLLATLLTDLIDGQGNRAVAVDLAQAVVGQEALPVFIGAARQADRRGTRLILKALPGEAHAALRSRGLLELVEVQPR